MKSFSGIGIGKTSEAIKQATAGLNEPQLIIFFSGIEVIEEASELLVEAYPGANVMGVAGSSYNNGKIIVVNITIICNGCNMVITIIFSSEFCVMVISYTISSNLVTSIWSMFAN